MLALPGARGVGGYTLYPTPYTLHPEPHTLHPTPYTLHPTPYTLHPTPYTLHPRGAAGGDRAGGEGGEVGRGGESSLLSREAAAVQVLPLSLSSLELSDTHVYEPQIRALLGTASHFCEVVVLSRCACEKLLSLLLVLYYSHA